MVVITYFVHGTTTDNEQHLATGWLPGELSALGRKQAIELGEYITGRNSTRYSAQTYSERSSPRS